MYDGKRGVAAKIVYDAIDKIKTKTKANLEVLKKISPDHVLFATGAKRNAPQIPGKELGHVFDGEELKSLLISSNSKAEKN